MGPNQSTTRLQRVITSHCYLAPTTPHIDPGGTQALNWLLATMSHDSTNNDCIVYVVDDDASVRKSLSWLLESANHVTHSFASAKEFLDNYDPSRASCLLLDMRMPESSGLQLQSTLDAQQVAIPIIFISGHVDVRIASEAFRAGACDVLTKPVDVDLLLERVAEALEKDKQQRLMKLNTESKRQQLENLTPKEYEVFQEQLKGRTIKQLAAHFGITFQTAAKHRARVLDKLNVDTDAQLINEFRDCMSP